MTLSVPIPRAPATALGSRSQKLDMGSVSLTRCYQTGLGSRARRASGVRWSSLLPVIERSILVRRDATLLGRSGQITGDAAAGPAASAELEAARIEADALTDRRRCRMRSLIATAAEYRFLNFGSGSQRHRGLSARERQDQRFQCLSWLR